MTDNTPPAENIQTAPPIIPPTVEYKIGSTTYIVSGKYKENAREGLLDKLWRLIENDAD